MVSCTSSFLAALQPSQGSLKPSPSLPPQRLTLTCSLARCAWPCSQLLPTIGLGPGDTGSALESGATGLGWVGLVGTSMSRMLGLGTGGGGGWVGLEGGSTDLWPSGSRLPALASGRTGSRRSGSPGLLCPQLQRGSPGTRLQPPPSTSPPAAAQSSLTAEYF